MTSNLVLTGEGGEPEDEKERLRSVKRRRMPESGQLPAERFEGALRMAA